MTRTTPCGWQPSPPWGSIGGPEARDVLVYCYESEDPEIREAASRALQAIEETEDPLGSVDLGEYQEEES